MVVKLNPDEQRRYLGTFEEKFLATRISVLPNSSELEHGFSILENSEKGRNTFVKISPNISLTKLELFYLKQARKATARRLILPLALSFTQVDLTSDEKGHPGTLKLWEKKKAEAPKKISIWRKWFEINDFSYLINDQYCGLCSK